MNTGESTRPSLVGGNGHGPASGGGRILADMEQRAPERPRAPKRAPAAPTSQRRVLLWCAGLIVLVLLLLAVFRAWQGAPLDRAQTFDDRPLPTQASPAPAIDDAAPDVARIVDAPVAGAGDDPFRRLGAASATATDPGPDATAAAAAAGAPVAVAPAARRPAVARRATGATAAAPAAEDGAAVDSGLFNTLMRIIHPDGSTAAAGDQHESMDSLVAQIRDDDARTRDQTRARLESLGGPQQTAAAREPRGAARIREQVEQALAACPRANTPAGIACRDRICTPHAGKLAVCPR